MNQPRSPLGQLSAQFATWRSTRLASRQATPLSLRQRAVSLKEAYPKREILPLWVLITVPLSAGLQNRSNHIKCPLLSSWMSLWIAVLM